MRDPDRLWDLLALPDEDLIEAVAGRRRAELHDAHRAFGPKDPPLPHDVDTTCRHRRDFPRALASSRIAPASLHVLGARRLDHRLDAAVAIMGTRRASDYGLEVARALAHGLTAAGLRVVTTFAEGISCAALTGAIEAGGAPIGVLSGGVDRRSPACCSGVYRQTAARGCLVSELPCGARSRPWSTLAGGRTAVLASKMVIVVEIEQEARELAWVALARALGRPIGAVPGRITSPVAAGANLLIKEGATLVRDAQDSLDALYGVSAAPPSPPDARVRSADAASSSPISIPAVVRSTASVADADVLDSRLRTTLRAVGDGRDTLAKLIDGGASPASAATALAELELLGLLARGDGGRYVPCLGAHAGGRPGSAVSASGR